MINGQDCLTPFIVKLYCLQLNCSASVFTLTIFFQSYNFMGVLHRISKLFMKIRQVGISGKELEVKFNFRYSELPSFTGYRCMLGKLVLIGNS